MTWFADLSPCSYLDAAGDRLAIGWLDGEHSFSEGQIDPVLRGEIFLDRLFWAVKHCSVGRTRGFHRCPFCGSAQSRGAVQAARGDQAVFMGSAQVDVCPPKGGPHLYAPNLVYHYVIEHGYRPPDAFVDAVILGTFVADDRPVGQLVPSTKAKRFRATPCEMDMITVELAGRLGTDQVSIERCVTVTVTWVGRVLASIPEPLPALSLRVEVGGPVPRSACTEWAPTPHHTSAAVERLVSSDPGLVEAIEEALTS